VAAAARIGLTAAGGKNLEVFSATVGRQLLDAPIRVNDESPTR
jgi:hypothetical protein